MTTRRSHGRLRSRRSYHRGGREGSLQCNIPSHMIGEKTVEDADFNQDSLTKTASTLGDVRVDRLLPASSRALRARGALALAVALASIALATRGLPRSRRGTRRVATPRPFPKRFPKVVGIPRGGALRSTGTPFQRRGTPVGAGGRHIPSAARRIMTGRRFRRIRLQDAAGASFFIPGEPGG